MPLQSGCVPWWVCWANTTPIMLHAIPILKTVWNAKNKKKKHIKRLKEGLDFLIWSHQKFTLCRAGIRHARIEPTQKHTRKEINTESGMSVHTCKTSSQESEARGSPVQDQFSPHKKFLCSQDYSTERLSQNITHTSVCVCVYVCVNLKINLL